MHQGAIVAISPGYCHTGDPYDIPSAGPCMDTKKKVYLSSTFIDLIEHRKAVKEALERARVVIECMEKYAASDERPKDKCLKDVAECDYYVLILAWRYGFQPPADNPDRHSITQMEYEEAVRLGKKPLVFLLDPEFDWKLKFLDPNFSSPDSAIAKFRNHVMLEHVCGSFTSPESLSSGVLSAIMAAEPEGASNNAAVRDLYLAWLRQTCESVELLGLDLRESQNVRLGQVYVPAVTPPKAEKSGKAKPEEVREERQALLLHRLGEESLYLPGAPGAGKTTFCRWLALVVATGSVPEHKLAVAKEFEEKLPGELRGRFPLLCRLREWAGHEGCLRGNGHWTRAELEQSLAAWLDQAKPGGLTWAAFHEELQAGRALLILDGVDEVPESLPLGHLPRRNLITGLADALPEWLKLGNRVLLTSRPYGLCDDDRRRVNLTVAELLELPEALQDTFVRRWYAAADPVNAEAKAGGLLVHLQEREDLAELRRNPMLLTALCVMYDQGQRLPQDFYKLYDAVIGQVLYKRYLTENERDKARWRLEAVALGMHLGESHALRGTPAAEVDIDEILRHLADYQRNDPTTETGSADARQAREDLLSNSGLLLPRSDGRAAFYHLSFQEFLAAVRLKRIGKPATEVLTHHAATPAWRRTLTFLFCTIADRDSPKAALDALASLLPWLAPQKLQQDPNPALLIADCLEVAHGRGWNSHRFADPLRQACDHALQHLNPPERAHLWMALGRLGWDDRPGVGVINPVGANSFAENKSNNKANEFAPTIAAIPDIDWVDIPEGPFLYGDKKTDITLPAFKIARYPVTNRQYQCFIDDGGYADGRWWQGLAETPLPSGEGRVRAERGRWNGPNQPRETVSWYEMVAYSRWLTAKLQAYGLIPEGMAVRLPTEQEWEKAARGTGGRKFPWGEEYQSGQANINETWGNTGTFNLGQTTAVGIYPVGVSPYGLLDMAGNVWEWCLNEYDQPERRGTEGDARRVARGGSWDYALDDARAAFRLSYHPGSRRNFVGFRLVCVAPILNR
ncbi:MAG: SUMF1/EgtB/PvdO family nonheme iron enzyme [Candidatus Methylumidiphilus sp.]